MKLSGPRLLLAYIVFIGLSRFALANPTDGPAGVTFFKGSWKDALAEAKRQNKPIFLDVFTSWCPPCKRMAKEAFPNARLGTKFNTHFINYQADAEKGEGIALAKHYAVASYPTALYIAPEGGLVHRSVGYGGVSAMINQADLVLAIPPLKATLAKGDKEYANGKRNPDFLKRYLKTRQTLNRPTSDVLDAYLGALPESERTTPEIILLVCNAVQASNTSAFTYLIKNQPFPSTSDLTEQRLSRSISGALHRVLNNEFRQACATKDEALLETIITNNERSTVLTNPSARQQEDQQQKTAIDYRLRFYKATKNFAKYRTIASSVADNQLMSQTTGELQKEDSVRIAWTKRRSASFPDSLKRIVPKSADDHSFTGALTSWEVANSLHEFASTYSDLSASPADWDLALTWVKRAIVLSRRPEYLITEANLLKKLGRSADTLETKK